MSESYTPRRRGCVDALHISLDSITNADMVGIGVVVASVVIDVCLRILMIPLPTTKILPVIDVGVRASLIQSYLILVSTFLSINRHQLSLFDANYALILTSSPPTMYLVAASIYEIFTSKSNLYKRIRSHRRTVRTFAVLLPFLWLALSMTLRLSGRAFKDSELCHGSTFKDWILYIIYYQIRDSILAVGGVLQTQFTVVILVPILALRLFKKRFRFIAGARACWKEASTPWGRLRIPWTFVKCAWNDRWCIYMLLTYFDIIWAFRVIVKSVYASGEGYVLSYGQVLSLVAATPTLISTVKFLYSYRRGLRHPRRRPRTQWLAPMPPPTTDNELDPHTQGSHLPFNITSYPGKPNLSELRDKITTTVRLTDQSMLLPELDPTVWSGWGQDTRPCTSCAKSADTAHGRV